VSVRKRSFIRRGLLAATVLVAGPVGALAVSGTSSATPKVIKEFAIPNSPSDPQALVNPEGIVAADGAMWITEARGDAIVRFYKPAGVGHQFTTYKLRTANAKPTGIAVGPKGLWFTEDLANRIGHITFSGHITEYPIPTSNSHPFGIVAGPDGALWFTQRTSNEIGRIMPDGTVKEFALPGVAAQSFPEEITVGPNGNLWFTLLFGNAIGELNPTTGKVKEFQLRNKNSQPAGITSANGVLWFTERKGNRIGEITVNGDITEFAIPTRKAKPFGIVVHGNNVFFAEKGADAIGMLDPASAKSSTKFGSFALPTVNARPLGIALGPSNNSVRVTEHVGDQIAILPLYPLGS
jgi:virginiamycin B lyase